MVGTHRLSFGASAPVLVVSLLLVLVVLQGGHAAPTEVVEVRFVGHTLEVPHHANVHSTHSVLRQVDTARDSNRNRDSIVDSIPVVLLEDQEGEEGKEVTASEDTHLHLLVVAPGATLDSLEAATASDATTTTSSSTEATTSEYSSEATAAPSRVQRLGYYGRGAWLVSCPRAHLRRMRGSAPHLFWNAVPFPAALKMVGLTLHPRQGDDTPVALRVTTTTALPQAPLREGGAGEGLVGVVGPLRQRHAGGWTVTCEGQKVQECAAALARLPQVVLVEREPEFRLHNYVASSIGQGGASSSPFTFPFHSRLLLGQNQIIGCADSGIDYDSCFFVDSTPPFSADGTLVDTSKRKIVAYQTIGDNQDGNEGHGTHVVGTLVGRSVSTQSWQNKYNGVAFESKVFFQDIQATGQSSLSIPGALEDLFTPPRLAGVAIHSNSWGDSTNAYNSNCQQVDNFAFSNRFFLPVFSAGNTGANGVGSINNPALAKNVLAVGSSQSSFLFLDGFTPSTGGDPNSLTTLFTGKGVVVEAQDACGVPPEEVSDSVAIILGGNCQDGDQVSFVAGAGAKAAILFGTSNSFSGSTTATIPTLKIISTVAQSNLLNSISNSNPDLTVVTNGVILSPTTAFSPDQVSSFSSIGPTVDGRIKPDVIGTGEQVISAYSDGFINLSTSQCRVDQRSGTSMATPGVSGLLAIARQYFTIGYYPTGNLVSGNSLTPTANLLKAVAINGGQYLQANASSVPNNIQGFGRVQLDRVLPLESENRTFSIFAVDDETLAQGSTNRFCFDLTNPDEYMKVTLVYNDYPGTPGSSSILVNDLDLEVDAPDGFYRGNKGLGSTSGDNINNVEQVHVVKPSTGRYRVTVRGITINQSPQYFAVLARGNLTQTACESSCPTGTTSTAQCAGNGVCLFGACKCNNGFAGRSCSQVVQSIQFEGSLQSGSLLQDQFVYYGFRIRGSLYSSSSISSLSSNHILNVQHASRSARTPSSGLWSSLVAGLGFQGPVSTSDLEEEETSIQRIITKPPPSTISNPVGIRVTMTKTSSEDGTPILQVRNGVLPTVNNRFGPVTVEGDVHFVEAWVSADEDIFVATGAAGGALRYSVVVTECLNCAEEPAYCSSLECRLTWTFGLLVNILVVVVFVLTWKATSRQRERNKLFGIYSRREAVQRQQRERQEDHLRELDERRLMEGKGPSSNEKEPNPVHLNITDEGSMFEEESMIVSGHDGRLDIDVEMEDLTPRGSAGGYGQPPAAFPGQEVTRSPVMRHSHSSLNSRTGSVYRDPTRTDIQGRGMGSQLPTYNDEFTPPPPAPGLERPPLPPLPRRFQQQEGRR